MDKDMMLSLLKADLQRTGNIPGDDIYLSHLLQAATGSLERQGVTDDGTADYTQVAVATAAWLYRKRVTGEAEPQFLKRMRLDLIVSQRARTANAT